MIPDIDDDLTRLGVLAVLRAAWGDETMAPVRTHGEWMVTLPPGWYMGAVDSEVSALLAALEAAP